MTITSFKCKMCNEHLYSLYYGGFKVKLNLKYCNNCKTVKTHYGYPHLTYFNVKP